MPCAVKGVSIEKAREHRLTPYVCPPPFLLHIYIYTPEGSHGLCLEKKIE